MMKIVVSKILVGLAIAALLLATSARAEDQGDSAEVDKLLVAAQRICPVSGEDLDAMGAPVKAAAGEQAIFLCCKDCIGKSISEKNWKTITANLIAAQGLCPVLTKKLPKNAPSIVIDHRRIFVCCKMCLPKVQKDPEKYIAVVNAMLQKNLEQSAN